jgi:hypothetical protein
MLSKVLETTSTPLPANGEWTSAWYDEPWANFIIMSASADKAGELFYEQSEDGTVVLFSYYFAIGANAPFYATLLRVARYARIRYRNGALPQTHFRASIAAADTIH